MTEEGLYYEELRMRRDEEEHDELSRRYWQNNKTVKVPHPLGKRVLLGKDEAPEASEGGIVIPENVREKPLTAHVISVGGDVTKLAPGDEVVFASFAGTEFNIAGQEVIVVDEEDIMLVLREVPNEPDANDN